MTTHLFQRAGEWQALVPADEDAAHWLHRLDAGQAIKADVRRARSPEQLRLWHALVRVIYEHQSQYTTHDDVHEALKIWLGYCQEIRLRDGRTAVKAKSIAFGNMTQDQFQELLDAAIKLVTEHIIPNTSDADLRQHLSEIVGVQPA